MLLTAIFCAIFRLQPAVFVPPPHNVFCSSTITHAKYERVVWTALPTPSTPSPAPVTVGYISQKTYLSISGIYSNTFTFVACKNGSK